MPSYPTGPQQPRHPGRQAEGGGPGEPLRGRVIPPGGEAPAAEPVFNADPSPAEADDEGATQVFSPVSEEPVGATQAIPPVQDDFYGGRPMFRDEVPPRSAESTAQFDLSGMDAPGERPSRRRSGSERPHRPKGPGRSGGLPRNKGLLLAGGFAALLLLGGGGAFLVASGGSGEGSGEYDVARVSNESTDGDPLSAGPLFPDTEIEAAGETFTLVITDETDQCATTAHGDYGDVLTENECRQVLRASYVNEAGDHAVTVGVAAMPDADKAGAAQEAQNLAESRWFSGLAGEEGSGTERMDIAGGHGAGGTWGRYMVFALAANSDGRVSEADASQLAEISQEFVNVPLKALGERARD
ncbi:hypothetical protein SAMN02745673_04039 [Marinactinospora thermotolerans DSM 45154]|uniref:Uncharacterized protein n=1 Tax=Marinactinospora thermotolerans DSM 45154 TaxID=1122192 RepID=A0A1T4SUB7_9ACTN|nr:hypothetical protein [Marinactinospora thermotolerans]SKA31890.1 hypothetical protein SAMN02745673_04039 [Marinactinospora thermotolerans DSM 45154]